MLIQQKIGKLQSCEVGSRMVDKLPLMWYETNKRILHKSTAAGVKLVLRFLTENPCFSQDDILFEDGTVVIIVDIQPADAIIITPSTMHQMASLCYEIGNKHLPLFIEEETVLVPYEEPLFRWLTASGFSPVRGIRKMLNPIKTNTIAHHHLTGSSSLFSKIMQLTKNNSDD